MKSAPAFPDLNLNRRQFLAKTATLASVAALGGLASPGASAAERFAPPIVVFSKVYRETKLTLEESAELTAEVGLDGVDCPVRAGDQILPERVQEDLPRYADLLRRRGLQLPLLTTAILSPDTPHTRPMLEAAGKLGIKFYRLGYARLDKGVEPDKVIERTKAQLKALAALNKELGVCALLQNHSPGRPSGPLGGDLGDLYEVVRDFAPEQIGVAFDLGHALIVHGDEWPRHFERLKPHIRIAYVKDTDRRKFVPFGEGEFGRTDFFKRLKAMNYTAPLSLHIEYDWDQGGKARNRQALAKALRDSVRTLRQWLAAA
jgi:L-ribulose-5-phosphate 3-epimerase